MLLAGDIKGINIEIGGNTTKLTNALKMLMLSLKQLKRN